MNDQYPETFPIEIERDKLCRFYRVQSFIACSIVPFAFGFLFGGASTSKDRQRDFENAEQVWSEFLRGAITGIGWGLLIGATLYFVFGHFAARRWATALEVAVEGDFLRVKEGGSTRRDRKLHFRAIVDYATFQNPLMRLCEIDGILITTTSGGVYSTINVYAVKNALEVRDMLSEIDRLREDS
ncbi:PH domain-containing protein [Bythopirellula goksoeyrii]|uniref:YdbS-like PH domain-containing protein n=1 Tax=Bythopirellula goksoeyrii TaxID=1400387 RepID=A0A5B9QV05_9BACT|nr:PH domain-containing protein [Bythopirellula goksoeyrii]QEG37831.1 hypothetical protein Pr1d_51790 [Bythopirellula goksoeyrii]